MINIGQKYRESRVSKVIISSVLARLTKFIGQLSGILRNLCLVNDFYFISNDSFTRYFICQDGTCTLARNFVDFINAINNF